MELFCPSTNLLNSTAGTPDQVHDDFNNSFINSSIVFETAGDSAESINITNNRISNWDYGDFTRKLAVPFLCAFGITGNVLNILILSKKIREGKKSIIYSFTHSFVILILM